MKPKWVVLLIALAALAWALYRWGNRLEFLLGGAMINIGYRLQDPLYGYDFEHEEATPVQVWEQFLRQNSLASSVREIWPRSARHPLLALVACMDGRLDTNELTGDTRRFYYVLRLAGSVLSVKEEEMLELAVSNGTRVVVFTTHSDCAAEKMAANPAQRVRFPELARAVDEREARFAEFQARPMIRERMAKGELLVKWMDIDTRTERLAPHAGN
jgi:hypothetical protein